MNQIPKCIWEHVLSFLLFDQTAWNRLICLSSYFYQITKKDWMCIRSVASHYKKWHGKINPSYLCLVCDVVDNNFQLPTSIRGLHIEPYRWENWHQELIQLKKLEYLSISTSIDKKDKFIVPPWITHLHMQNIPSNFAQLTNLIILDLRGTSGGKKHLEMNSFIHLRDFYFYESNCTWVGDIPSLQTMYILLSRKNTLLTQYAKQCPFVQNLSLFINDMSDLDQIVFLHIKILEIRYFGALAGSINYNKYPDLEEIRVSCISSITNIKKEIRIKQVNEATLCKKIYCETNSIF